MGRNVISISIPGELVDKLDKVVYEERYRTRSAAVAEAICRFLKEDLPEPKSVVPKPTAEDKRRSRAERIVGLVHREGYRFVEGVRCAEDPATGNNADMLMLLGADDYHWWITNWRYVNLKATEEKGSYRGSRPR